jgi:hypothetical protein
MKKLATLFLVGVAALLLGSAPLSAKAPEARAIAQEMFKYVGTLDKYAFDATVVNDDLVDDKKVQRKHTVSAIVDRPDRFRVQVNGDVRNRTSYLNNGTFSMIDHGHNYYGQLKTAKSIDKTLDYLFDRYGIEAPLAQLLYSDLHKRSKMSKSKYFGKAMAGGVECDYVAFEDDKKIVYIWIATGDKPLVQRFIIIDKTEPKAPQSSVTLKWNDTKISDNDFIFSAPKEASKISIEPAN